MDKKENLILEEIKKDVKEILELLKNPKNQINNERRQYNPNYPEKKTIILKHPNDPLTQGQRDFLTKNLYNGDIDILTQAEASQIIEEYIKNKGYRSNE